MAKAQTTSENPQGEVSQQDIVQVQEIGMQSIEPTL